MPIVEEIPDWVHPSDADQLDAMFIAAEVSSTGLFFGRCFKIKIQMTDILVNRNVRLVELKTLTAIKGTNPKLMMLLVKYPDHNEKTTVYFGNENSTPITEADVEKLSKEAGFGRLPDLESRRWVLGGAEIKQGDTFTVCYGPSLVKVTDRYQGGGFVRKVANSARATGAGFKQFMTGGRPLVSK